MCVCGSSKTRRYTRIHDVFAFCYNDIVNDKVQRLQRDNAFLLCNISIARESKQQLSVYVTLDVGKSGLYLVTLVCFVHDLVVMNRAASLHNLAMVQNIWQARK